MLKNNLITDPHHPLLSYLTDCLVERCYPGSGWTLSKVLERFKTTPLSFMLTSPSHDAFALWERVGTSTYLLECHAVDPEAQGNTLVELFAEGNEIMESYTEGAGLLHWMYKPRNPDRLPSFRALADWWHLQGALLLDESLSGRAGLIKVGEVDEGQVKAALPHEVKSFTWEVPSVLLQKRQCGLFTHSVPAQVGAN